MVPFFGASRGASGSARDSVATAENVGGDMVASGGGGAALTEVSTGSSMTTVLGTVSFPALLTTTGVVDISAIVVVVSSTVAEVALKRAVFPDGCAAFARVSSFLLLHN